MSLWSLPAQQACLFQLRVLDQCHTERGRSLVRRIIAGHIADVLLIDGFADFDSPGKQGDRK